MSTKIEWTHKTWNVTLGCRRVSPGCQNCYAEVMAGRLALMGQKDYEGLTTGTGSRTRWTGVTRFLPERLSMPLRWKKPCRIFVNSMSDLFHDGFTFEQIAAVFGVMAACPQHTFQVLTKRPDRAVAFYAWAAADRRRLAMCMPSMENGDMVSDRLQFGPWPLPNVWLGVSVENQATADERIPLLLRCPAAVRWVSAEPLLGAVDLAPYLTGHEEHGVDLSRSAGSLVGGAVAHTPGLDWVVAGGESGHGARPMHPDWASDLRDQCQAAGAAFLFKQNGAWVARHPEATGVPLDDSVPRVRLTICGCNSKTDETCFGVPGGGTRHACDFSQDAWVQRVGKKAAGRLLDGRTWDEYPAEVDRG